MKRWGRVMDRIEKLLQSLIDEQDTVTFSNAMAGLCADDVSEASYMQQVSDAQADRDALRQQIADEWRAKDAALEELVGEAVDGDFACDSQGKEWPEITRAKAALSRARGE